MHREFDPADQPFTPRSNTGLYLLTALIAGLLVADLWPPFTGWLATLGLEVPSWPGRHLYGFRLATIAAVLGGVRTLFYAFDKLASGRIGADLAIVIAALALQLASRRPHGFLGRVSASVTGAAAVVAVGVLALLPALW